MSGAYELASVFKSVMEEQDFEIIPVRDEFDEDLRTEFNVEDIEGETFRVIILREDAP